MSRLITLLGLWVLAGSAIGQISNTPAPDSLSYEEKYQQEYRQRVKKSHINGFYIPKDLGDAVQLLDQIVDEDGKRKFANRTDSIAVNTVFFSFGRWINVNWGFEGGSRLTVALNKLGVSYPDDMTKLIMYAFHRYLNQRDLDLQNLIPKIKEERLEREREAKNIGSNKP